MKYLLAPLICIALLAGCSPRKSTDLSDEKNPLIDQGLDQIQEKSWEAAILSFEAALDSDQSLARADLELSLLYHQRLKNYVRAIYHYERYLEKRPDSEKAPLINSWIEQAKVSFAAEAGSNSSGISDELVRLTRENNLLRKQIEQGAGNSPRVLNVKTMRKTPVEPTKTYTTSKNIPATPVPHATYTVQKGDTLSRIARTVYGDVSKLNAIYEANDDVMKNKNDLKVGQVIRIP